MAVIFQIVVGNYPVPDYQQMWTEWVMIKLDLVEIQESSPHCNQIALTWVK
ncbi:hypothetical protein [Limnofasciculus baicalensis]|uniref:Uncharacterized protein n=1 Tax=Limnofasciculus baicalensis BBK-W-15 TaxID=2699891 RepID=A0AAE3GS97_9CYAN|nr:hypothetical protein [Limnofasciculus baicalensis]MCP2728898.1 hypothetical protein [Limnofasciculus baicalensis BBK-W-15]